VCVCVCAHGILRGGNMSKTQVTWSRDNVLFIQTAVASI
jgi:hypothetical protein